MSREMIFASDDVRQAFHRAAEDFGIDEARLYEPGIIRQICISTQFRYLHLEELGDKLMVKVPFGLAEIKNYKPALKVKGSLANERVFRDLHLPMRLEEKEALIKHLLDDAKQKGVEVIAILKMQY